MPDADPAARAEDAGMALDPHPGVHLSAPGDLGPDPEPLGERYAELMRRERAGRLAAPPAECPLARATGACRACFGASCIFFRVPGVDSACAPLEWSPGVAHDPQLAGWYLARRADAAVARMEPALPSRG